MNQKVKMKISWFCLAVLLCYVSFAIGAHISLLRPKLSRSKLAYAVAMAQEKIDALYGDDAFLYGINRVVRDGDKDYYGFFLTLQTRGIETNILVDVDMISSSHGVHIRSLPSEMTE